jgi:predicted nucleotidyltransferase
MLAEKDRQSIVSIAHKYKVSRVLLFGSSLSDKRDPEDIDLAVEGIPPSDFFSFYSDLIFSLSKPVDLVDLSDASRFHRMVASEGVPVYG